MKLYFPLLFSVIATFFAHAQSPEVLHNIADWRRMEGVLPNHYICLRAAAPITVDGNLDKPSWKNAAWTADFVDIESGSKPKPRFRTRAKIVWDDDYLYIGAELEEPHVWATLTAHDSVIFQDPDFEVFIDPNGDSLDYYEFEINALNTSWDLRLDKPYKDNGTAYDSWNIPGLKTGVRIRGTLNNPTDKDTGWTVEIAFPWKVLKEYAGTPAPPRDGDQWRMDFSRVEWEVRFENEKYIKLPGRKEDNWVWSPQGIIDMHRPEQWGFVQFSTNNSGAPPFRPDPAFKTKRALQGLYYAQRDFHATTGRWARDLDELSKKTGFAIETVTIELKSRQGGYTASATVIEPGRGPQRWHIREDARIWAED